MYERRVEDETSSAKNQAGSQIFVVRDEQAASELLPLVRRLLLAATEPLEGNFLTRHSLPAPNLGDEALKDAKVIASPDRSFDERITAWTYFWRRGNVVALAQASDAVGDFDRLSTLDLAATVDARITD